jgi:phosphatidylglycerophosphate synthase
MPHECLILADAPGALVEVCGISILERLLRTLQRCGIARATVLSRTPELIEEHLAKPSWARDRLDATVRERPDGAVTIGQIVDVWPRDAQLLLVVRGDCVFDNRLLQSLSAKTSASNLIDSAAPAKLQWCGAALLQHDWTLEQSGSLEQSLNSGTEKCEIAALDLADQPLYSPALRRNLRPFWFSAPPAGQEKQAESVLLNSVQKGTQDFPAYIHAPIEKFLVSHLCKTSITPNQLTIVWAIGALATTVLFSQGQLVWGIAVALIVGIIDGLDGKQARIKVETTKGGKLEHRLDSFFEVAWPTALAFHFYVSGQLPGAFRYLLILIVAEAIDGIGKGGIYFAAEKLHEEPGLFDRMVRLVGGRRNIYIWMLALGVIWGAPEKAFIVMAWWEVATAVFDLPHGAWALHRLRKKTRWNASQFSDFL